MLTSQANLTPKDFEGQRFVELLSTLLLASAGVCQICLLSPRAFDTMPCALVGCLVP